MRGGEQSKEAKQPKRKVNDGGNAGGESADLAVDMAPLSSGRKHHPGAAWLCYDDFV